MVIVDFLKNLWKGVLDTRLRELMPPAVVDVLLWTRDTVPRGLGFADRESHLTGTFALAIVLIIASLSVLTWLAVGYLLVMLPIAVARFSDPIDKRWPVGTKDWPLWELRREGFESA